MQWKRRFWNSWMLKMCCHDPESVIRLAVLNTRVTLITSISWSSSKHLLTSRLWSLVRTKFLHAQHLPASRFHQAAEDGLAFFLVVATKAMKPSSRNAEMLPWKLLTLETRGGPSVCGYLQNFSPFPKLTLNWISALSRQPTAPWGVRLRPGSFVRVCPVVRISISS